MRKEYVEAIEAVIDRCRERMIDYSREQRKAETEEEVKFFLGLFTGTEREIIDLCALIDRDPIFYLSN